MASYALKNATSGGAHKAVWAKKEIREREPTTWQKGKYKSKCEKHTKVHVESRSGVKNCNLKNVFT